MAATDANTSKIVDAVVDRMREAFPPQYPSQSPTREVPPRMSENGNGVGQVAALQTKVAGLEHQFDGFRESFDKQIGGLADTINKFIDKVDGRFAEIAKAQNEKASTDRSTIWIIVGIAASSIIGLLGVGATFWSLSQAPVTSELARHDLDLREIHASYETRDELKANFKILSDAIQANTSIINTKADQAVQSEIVKRLEMSNQYEQRELDLLNSQINNLVRDSASKAEVAGVNERMTTLSNRLSAFAEKFTAVPKDPRLQ